MKVAVQIIDSKTGITQNGVIEEPVTKGHEIDNALAHFGIRFGDIEWYCKGDTFQMGSVSGTTKLVSVIHWG